MKYSFALIKLREKAQANACLVAFTFLYFNIFKSNASGSWATIAQKYPSPCPEGGLGNLSIVPHKSHAES